MKSSSVLLTNQFLNFWILDKELQIIGQDFVFGIIQAADQERDPRNLLILFSIFPVVARYFKLEPFTEEFFEVFSCYFPIDFTPVSKKKTYSW